MRRDMDLIRAIILAARECPDLLTGMDGVPSEMFAYHVQIMEEAGFVKAKLIPNGDKRKSVSATLYRLTCDGQDFADSITDETIWKRAKETVIKPSASWTFDILKAYLKAEIARHIPGI